MTFETTVTAETCWEIVCVGAPRRRNAAAANGAPVDLLHPRDDSRPSGCIQAAPGPVRVKVLRCQEPDRQEESRRDAVRTLVCHPPSPPLLVKSAETLSRGLQGFEAVW